MKASTQVMMMPPPPPQPQPSSNIPKRRGTKRSDHDEDGDGDGGDTSRTPVQKAPADVVGGVNNNKKKSVAFKEDPILEEIDDDELLSSPPNSRNSIFQRHVAQLTSSSSVSSQQQPAQQQQYQQQQHHTASSYLTHLSPNWPGDTGNGQHHLDVRPMIFHDLLSNHRIVIPLFQRRYCWTRKQIYQWYHDIVHTTSSSSSSSLLEFGTSGSGSRGNGALSSVHRTHKTMFKRDLSDDDDDYNNYDTLLCIDGQQRITTLMLFLCALRSECRRTMIGNEDYGNNQMKNSMIMMSLIDEIDEILLLKKTTKGSKSTTSAEGHHKNRSSSMKHWANEQAKELIHEHKSGDNMTQSRRSVVDDDTTSGSREESTSSSTWTIKEFPVGWLPSSSSVSGEENISKKKKANVDEDDDCDDESPSSSSSLSSSSPTFHPTLIPSYIDRGPFFEILTKDYIQESIEQQLHGTATRTSSSSTIQIPTIDVSTKCRESNQYLAYNIFQRELRALIRRSSSSSSSSAAESQSCRTTSTFKLLHKLFRKQVYGFSLMYIELLGRNETTNMQQIFLWMQEKTIFGMGRLLYNPHPGIDFTPIDLARNLVVSCVMNEPLHTQMEFYKQCWIVPLELRFNKGRADVLGDILKHFVKRIVTTSTNNRYVGDMEQKLEQFKLAVPPKLHDMFRDDNPMMVYAKFHSYVQQRAIEMYNARNSSSMIITDDTTPAATTVTNPNTIITKDVADTIVQELVQEGINMGL